MPRASSSSSQDDIIYISEIARVAFGRRGALLANFCAVVTQLGFCCAYVIFVGDNLHSLIPKLSVLECVLCAMPVFIGLSWLRSLRVSVCDFLSVEEREQTVCT